jgi:molybdopterin adenylyltransferase
MRVAVLTISSAGSRGERNDTSGDAIVSWAQSRGYEITQRTLVADDVNAIVRALVGWCDGEVADLVLTTGGTGLSPTDVTPEATGAVIEREAPGFSECVRMSAAPRFPRAILSRGVSGVRHRSLIINLPGSPGGVTDALAALEAVVDHAVAVLRGEVGDHGGRKEG